jgi:uncharacterized protein DUF3987
MIRESEVIAALAQLPETSFIRIYVEYATTQVASPMAYHVGIALSAVASTAPGDLMCSGFPGETLANFWTIIVGDSGQAQKGLAMKIMQHMLSEAAPGVVAPDPTSDETLVQMLANQAQRIFIYPEFVSILNAARGRDGGRGLKLLDQLTNVFDGISFDREYTKGKIWHVVHPRVSLLGACTPRHLEDCTTILMWEGGFLSRAMILYAEREREFVDPLPDPARRSWLVGTLCMFAGTKNAAVNCGMTPGAKQMWIDWLRMHEARVRVMEERMRGPASRVGLILAKMAMLIAWSCGDADPTRHATWMLEEQHMRGAIALAELHFASLCTLVERIEPTQEMRELRAVFNAINPEWTGVGDICRVAHLTAKRLVPYLDTLKLQGRIMDENQNGTVFWRALPEAKPKTYNHSFEGMTAPPIQFPVLAGGRTDE